MLNDWTMKQYAAELASAAQAPGGGSAAAYVGALGAALLQMAMNLSFGKKAYEAQTEEEKAAAKADFDNAVECQKMLEEMTDADKTVFEAFMAAMALPKTTEEEKAARAQAMDAASVNCLSVPRQVAATAFRLMEHTENAARYCNRALVSDVGVSVEFAYAALKSAVINVRVNLPYVKDEAVLRASEEELARYEGAEAIYKAVRAIVDERL